MDTNLLAPRSDGFSRWPAILAALEIGAEANWIPEYLRESAWHEHVPFAFWIVKALQPRTIVELGTHWGVSYSAFCQAVERQGLGARCYAVDSWEGDPQAGYYGEQVFASISEFNDRRWRRFSTLLRMRFDEARVRFADGEVDLLHIDGFHTYEAVADDFATWRDALSSRAVVLFHDTNVRRDDFGVWRFWNEIAADHAHFEFVHGHGLGVLGIGSELPTPVQMLFRSSSEDAAIIRDFFAARGEAVQDRFQLNATAGRLEAERQSAAVKLTGLEHERDTLVAELHKWRSDAEAARRAVDSFEKRIAELDRRYIAATHAANEKERLLQEKVNELQSSFRQLEEAGSRRETSLLEHIDRLQRDRGELEARYHRESSRALAMENARVEATQKAAALTRRAGHLESELARTEDERRAAKSQLASMETALLQLRSEHERILRSTCWQATFPLRVAGTALPAGLRNALRRSAKLIWWTATLRLPAKLKERTIIKRNEAGADPPASEPEPTETAPPLAVQEAVRNEVVAPVQAAPDDGGLVTARCSLERRFEVLQPLRTYPVFGAQPRISIVTDSLNPGLLYGGVATALILGAALARRTGAGLRVVTRYHEADPGAVGNLLTSVGTPWDDDIDCVFSPHSEGMDIPVGKDDLFLTTSWWTTRATTQSVAPNRILYLLQEDERMFYARGDERVRCAETLASDDIWFAVNSEMLFRHFVQGEEALPNIARRGCWFEPAFPDLHYYDDVLSRRSRIKRNFLFYARPNNLRNLYWRGLEAISDAIEDRTLSDDEWNFIFVGRDLHPIELPRGIRPIIRENLPWNQYAALVRDVDLGLCLIDTPHPSYPPLDIAASGGVAVTNTCGLKTSLEKYSSNIVCKPPSAPALKEGIASAIAILNDELLRSANYARSSIQRNWVQALQPVIEYAIQHIA